MKSSFGVFLMLTLGLVGCGGAEAPPGESSPTTLPATTTAPPAEAADTDAAVAEPEKLVAKIKNLMTDEQVELGGPIVNSVDIVLVPISAGEFLMGSPETEVGRDGDEPQHKLSLIHI
mgnify:CR=1 FL=1